MLTMEEIKKMDRAEIEKKVAELKKEYFEKKQKLLRGEHKDIAEFKKIRRTVARLLTAAQTLPPAVRAPKVKTPVEPKVAAPAEKKVEKVEKTEKKAEKKEVHEVKHETKKHEVKHETKKAEKHEPKKEHKKETKETKKKEDKKAVKKTAKKEKRK